VVAPHPDDDVIGCGGTLFGLTRDGIQPTVLYVTDGRASHPNSLRFPMSKLARMRENEAREALCELGVRTEPIFLRVHDGTLSALDRAQRQWIIGKICAAISNLAIDTLLGPWSHDPHADHVATARAIRMALRSIERRPRSIHYIVWASIRSSEKRLGKLAVQSICELELDAEQIDAKRRALSRHKSQVSDLIDDDPEGFRIDSALLHQWLQPVERFYQSC
jgi:LmbE family N-acetylglucosaminyl deacetylase